MDAPASGCSVSASWRSCETHDVSTEDTEETNNGTHPYSIAEVSAFCLCTGDAEEPIFFRDAMRPANLIIAQHPAADPE